MGLVAGVGEGPDDYEVVTLPPHVVSATRTPQDPRHVPGSVSLLQPVELGQAQTELLSNALGTVPGITVVSTGGAGGQVSVFIRGASSHHTLFVVDGVRMNDRSAAYQNFLGGADLSGLDRVEVLRGPQSTLYGSAALGGVILLDTAYGCGSPSGIFSASVGSFESRGGRLRRRGRRAGLAGASRG